MMYLRLAALVAFMAIAGLALWYRAEAATAAAAAAQARANLAVAEDANRAQEETIGRLRASEAANTKAIAEFVDQLEAINKAVADTNESVDNLEKSNATVAEYLRTAVPDDLRKLLDR